MSFDSCDYVLEVQDLHHTFQRVDDMYFLRKKLQHEYFVKYTSVYGNILQSNLYLDLMLPLKDHSLQIYTVQNLQGMEFLLKLQESECFYNQMSNILL